MSSEPSEPPASGRRTVVYCVVPRDLAAKLHEPLRRHFRDDPGVEVLIERRRSERRQSSDRRADGTSSPGATGAPARAPDLRRIRAAEGRRAGERRAALTPVEAPRLPRGAARYAQRLSFVERVEPSSERAEDRDTARVVARFQAGDREAFSLLYMRYFDRVYSYLRVIYRDPHEAEDATQQVFTKVFEALPGYERRRQPFRAWLFVIARNYALGELRKLDRLEPMAPDALRDRRARAADEPDPELPGWITDRELLMFVERLPEPQRQVLVLRFLLDLSHTEVAAVLGRNADDVRGLQHRALVYLRERLVAVGRGPQRGSRSARMRRCRDHALVLRSRRFALIRGGPSTRR